MAKIIRSVILTAMLIAVCAVCSAKEFCFIGDSRFVGMKDAVGSPAGTTWIARVSAGNGLYGEYADRVGGLDRDTVIVYGLGVNDLDSSQCIRNLHLLANMGFREIYFTTVAPVDEAKEAGYGYSRTNEEIRRYNNTVIASLPEKAKIIDSYGYLAGGGFETGDGLHYSNDTYRRWYSLIMESAGQQ